VGVDVVHGDTIGEESNLAQSSKNEVEAIDYLGPCRQYSLDGSKSSVKITHISANNWRNFKTIDFNLERRLFIVGPNAAGKSNLLDLFRFLGEVAAPGGGLASAISSRGGLSKVRSLFSQNFRKGRLIIDVDLIDGDTSWRYRLSIKGESGASIDQSSTKNLSNKTGRQSLSTPTQWMSQIKSVSHKHTLSRSQQTRISAT
jgi:hypothetical protein